MAKEYIDKEAVLDAMIAAYNCDDIDISWCTDVESVAETIYCAMKEVVYATPAADVAPVVHSKWIRTDYDEAEWLCMNCKESLCLADAMVDPIEDAKLFYCPNCGAKMDGGAEDDL